ATSHHLLGRLTSERLNEQQGLDMDGDGFTEAVADYIRLLGWSVSSAQEDGVFGLDYAIEDPSTGQYVIGIECDAPRHFLLNGARAREIWRPAAMSRAIPKVHRVSCHGWYHAGDQERAALKSAI